MSNKKVVILFGGKSVEHEISINSAKNVYQYIDKNLYDVYLIGISKAGSWFFTDEVTGEFDNFNSVTLNLNAQKPIFSSAEEEIIPDIVFPVLHGTDGEDGSIQGLLQAMNIPFAGSGVLGSAVAMSKLASKRLLEAANIPTSRFLPFSSDQKGELSFEALTKELGLPFMAKAANLGSSVGVVKVKDEISFSQAIEECFRFDTTVLFEEYIAGRELECSVMDDAGIKASKPAEIVISEDYEFYTYEAKYKDPNAVELKVPAELPDSISDQIRDLSIQAYQALQCQGFARVDLFLTAEGNIYINEINTIPGFTNSSMFPMMWQEQGISFTELITKIISNTFDKFEARKHLEKDYTGS